MSDKSLDSVKTIAKGAGFFIIGMFASKVITYFYRLFIARYFGPEDFGLFSLGLAVTGILLTLASLGLPNAVLRNVSFYETRQDSERLRGTILFSLIGISISSILTTILLYILSEEIALNIFHNVQLVPVIQIMAFSIPFMALLTVVAQIFGGFRNAKYKIFTERIALNIFSLILVITLGLMGLGVNGIALSYTIATFITFLISIYILEFKVYNSFRSKIKPIFEIRETLSFSLPLVLAGVAASFAQWTDTLMIGYFMDATEVGIYNVVLATGFLLTAIAPALGTLLLPVLSDIYARGKKDELENISKTVSKWIYYFNLPLFLIILIYPTKMLTILFGVEYAAGHTALFILAIGFFISSMMLVESNILILLKKTKITMGITIAGGIINISLNYFLIPPYGINGAAVASAVSFVFSGILFITTSWYYSRILSFSKYLIKSTISGILAMVIILFPVNALTANLHPILLFIIVGVFTLLYGIFLLVMGGFQSTDIEIMRSIENRTGIKINFIRNLVKRFSS